MNKIRTRIGEGGRLVVPAAYRRVLGVEPGDEVLLILDGRELRILTPQEAVRKAQAIVRRYVPPGESLVDELLEERRAEAERE